MAADPRRSRRPVDRFAGAAGHATGAERAAGAAWPRQCDGERFAVPISRVCTGAGTTAIYRSGDRPYHGPAGEPGTQYGAEASERPPDRRRAGATANTAE